MKNTSRATPDWLEQPFDGEIVENIATTTTGSLCACGWPQQPCLKLTSCMSVNYSGGRTA